jgi:ferredoxin
MATVEPGGLQFAVQAGQTLLQAALAAGVALPRLCRMVAGSVRYRIEWPGLSAEEKAEGCVLPCVAEPASDVTLHLARPVQAASLPPAMKPAP